MYRINVFAPFLTALVALGCNAQTQIGQGAGGEAGSGEDAGRGGDSAASGSGGTQSGGQSGAAGTGTAGGRAGTGATGGTGGSAGSGYQPCAGKPCGAQCTQCSPDDPGCGETAAIKFCSDEGSCVTPYPTCGATECDDNTGCVQPGAACELCDDGSSACLNVACVNGKCVSTFPICPATECTMDADCPSSLAPCVQCQDGSTACPWARCDNGTCTAGIDSCGSEDPCAGKACGDLCTLCDGESCQGTDTVVYACDQNLTCQPTPAQCGGAGCETNEECNMTDDCPQCPGINNCVGRTCVEGQCLLICPEPTDPCGGCDTGEVCIYQVGGPGPSAGFRCAVQTDCDAPGPCACIIGEGQCMFTEGTAGEAGYCSCDNGLD